MSSSLPAGTDLNNATAGFKNFGQFVAAINVSNHLRIPFADLKATMTGIDLMGNPVVTGGSTDSTTAAPTLTLGRAIQKLKPGVNAEAVAQTALTQANQEINTSTTTTTPTASTSTTSTASSTSRSTTTTKSTPTTGATTAPSTKAKS